MADQQRPGIRNTHSGAQEAVTHVSDGSADGNNGRRQRHSTAQRGTRKVPSVHATKGCPHLPSAGLLLRAVPLRGGAPLPEWRSRMAAASLFIWNMALRPSVCIENRVRGIDLYGIGS